MGLKKTADTGAPLEARAPNAIKTPGFALITRMPHPDAKAGIHAAVNARDYGSLLKQLDELKGAYAGLYLLEAAGNSDQGLAAIQRGLALAMAKQGR